jgi:5-methylthioadenosine/S-adenosylhomocysteine deaminase
MSRYLVIGDPVVTLGAGTLIPDGALIVEDDSVVRAGPRAELENDGPFDKVLGSARHFVMPGFVNCHYRNWRSAPGSTSSSANGAHVYVGSARGVAGAGPHNAILWGW